MSLLNFEAVSISVLQESIKVAKASSDLLSLRTGGVFQSNWYWVSFIESTTAFFDAFACDLMSIII